MTEVKHLLEAVNQKYDYDFRHYSPSFLKRMVAQALKRLNCLTVPALEEKVMQTSENFHVLLQTFTVPVSEMFRDPLYFLALREKVIPFLKTYPSVKIWIPGCSTGEEVFSIAILLHEEGLLNRAALYATDINEKCLARARSGIFDFNGMENAEENYRQSGGKHALQDYYLLKDGMAHFQLFLVKNAIFADHSLVTDTVFAETHLISCRNVVMYFNRDLQDHAFALFHESLCRLGFLGLGINETIQFSKHAREFDLVDKGVRIWRKK